MIHTVRVINPTEPFEADLGVIQTVFQDQPQPVGVLFPRAGVSARYNAEEVMPEEILPAEEFSRLLSDFFPACDPAQPEAITDDDWPPAQNLSTPVMLEAVQPEEIVPAEAVAAEPADPVILGWAIVNKPQSSRHGRRVFWTEAPRVYPRGNLYTVQLEARLPDEPGYLRYYEEYLLIEAAISSGESEIAELEIRPEVPSDIDDAVHSTLVRLEPVEVIEPEIPANAEDVVSLEMMITAEGEAVGEQIVEAPAPILGWATFCPSSPWYGRRGFWSEESWGIYTMHLEDRQADEPLFIMAYYDELCFEEAQPVLPEPVEVIEPAEEVFVVQEQAETPEPTEIQRPTRTTAQQLSLLAFVPAPTAPIAEESETPRCVNEERQIRIDLSCWCSPGQEKDLVRRLMNLVWAVDPASYQLNIQKF